MHFNFKGPYSPVCSIKVSGGSANVMHCGILPSTTSGPSCQPTNFQGRLTLASKGVSITPIPLHFHQASRSPGLVCCLSSPWWNYTTEKRLCLLCLVETLLTPTPRHFPLARGHMATCLMVTTCTDTHTLARMTANFAKINKVKFTLWNGYYGKLEKWT